MQSLSSFDPFFKKRVFLFLCSNVRSDDAGSLGWSYAMQWCVWFSNWCSKWGWKTRKRFLGFTSIFVYLNLNTHVNPKILTWIGVDDDAEAMAKRIFAYEPGINKTRFVNFVKLSKKWPYDLIKDMMGYAYLEFGAKWNAGRTSKWVFFCLKAKSVLMCLWGVQDVQINCDGMRWLGTWWGSYAWC